MRKPGKLRVEFVFLNTLGRHIILTKRLPESAQLRWSHCLVHHCSHYWRCMCSWGGKGITTTFTGRKRIYQHVHGEEKESAQHSKLFNNQQFTCRCLGLGLDWCSVCCCSSEFSVASFPEPFVHLSTISQLVSAQSWLGMEWEYASPAGILSVPFRSGH